MKELSVEEKAKAYDEAIEKMQKYVKDEYGCTRLRPEDIFPELKESEDEKIRKVLINQYKGDGCLCGNNFRISYEDIRAWFEKQGEHVNFLNKIQIGDKVTRNKDGMLVNLSQLDRVAKKDEKQGEQKSAMIQWKGNNLKEVIEFTGKAPQFEKWFKTFDEYEQYVHEHNNIFKLFYKDGSHYEIPVGAWIVKTPDGYNVASKAVYKQKPNAWSV